MWHLRANNLVLIPTIQYFYSQSIFSSIPKFLDTYFIVNLTVIKLPILWHIVSYNYNDIVYTCKCMYARWLCVFILGEPVYTVNLASQCYSTLK